MRESLGQKPLSGDLDTLLQNFEPISLDQMGDCSLMNRTDTKFVMNMDALLESLEEISRDYRILEIKGQRQGNYLTLYFDTMDLQMYRNHHNGIRNRYKVRIRKYLDSDQSFFEVKFKNNKGKTIKNRVRTGEQTIEVNSRVAEFITTASQYRARDLEPKLWNRFTRITLVSRIGIERVTLDMNLQFANTGLDRFDGLPGVVVAEVKREAHSRKSEFVRLMQEKSVKQEGFSKYCIGVSMIFPDVKKNNFKEKIRLINKMTRKAA